MSTVHTTPNTDKFYPCVSCGSESINIVREAPNLENTRVKCNQCNMVYSASDSLELVEKGQIPDGPPKVPEHVRPRDDGRRDGVENHAGQADRRVLADSGPPHKHSRLPKAPSFVFISTDGTTEFCTKRDLKKTVLAWQHKGVKHKVYELNERKVSAKVDIQ